MSKETAAEVDAKPMPEKVAPKLPTASEVVNIARKLDQSLSIMRMRDCAVLGHYLGSGGLAGGRVHVGSNGEVPASARLRALEGMTHGGVMRNVIDTLLSQTVRPPNFTVETLGQTWGFQRTARKAEQWLTGMLHAGGWPEVKWRVCTDAATCSIAGVRLWFDKDGLHLDRQRPDTVIFNPRAGRNPRDLWLRYGVDREELLLRFPDAAAKILDKTAKKYHPDPLYEFLDLLCYVETDEIEVFEHWKLGTEENPGTYTIVLGDGETILNPKDEDRVWAHPFFPFAPLRYSFSWDSFAGQSLGQQLLGDQLQLNKMAQIIDNAQAKNSIARTFIQKGTEVDRNQYAKLIGEFIDYVGQAPVTRPAVAISPEYYERFQKIEDGMYERFGVSRSAATNQIPAGLAGASGKALQTYNNSTAVRSKRISDQIDDMDERVGTIALALAVDFFKRNPGAMPVSRASGSRVLREIDWKELNIQDMNGVAVRTPPTSSLPTDPAARLEYVTDAVKAGQMSPRYGMKLVANNDVETMEDTRMAAIDLAQAHIEDVLYDGKHVSPEPNQEYLETLLDLGTLEMMRAVRLDADKKEHEKEIQMLRVLLEVARDMLKKLAPSPSPLPAPAGPGSGGPPALQATTLPPGGAPAWQQ